MTKPEKDALTIRFGLALQKIIQENKLKAEQNKIEGQKDIHLIDSLRKLEAASGIPYASIHRISVGTKNAGFTTIASLIEGLNITLDEFFSIYYYPIEQKDIERSLKGAATRKPKVVSKPKPQYAKKAKK